MVTFEGKKMGTDVLDAAVWGAIGDLEENGVLNCTKFARAGAKPIVRANGEGRMKRS